MPLWNGKLSRFTSLRPSCGLGEDRALDLLKGARRQFEDGDAGVAAGILEAGKMLARLEIARRCEPDPHALGKHRPGGAGGHGRAERDEGSEGGNQQDRQATEGDPGLEVAYGGGGWPA
jgi:hypothetical protein